jgi:hypothetical protein
MVDANCGKRISGEARRAVNPNLTAAGVGAEWDAFSVGAGLEYDAADRETPDDP